MVSSENEVFVDTYFKCYCDPFYFNFEKNQSISRDPTSEYYYILIVYRKT